jgi:hypothetical protein
MTPTEKDWRTGIQPHSHTKYKSFLCLCVYGWGGRSEAAELTRKWLTELYRNDLFQALNPCTDLEGPLQGHSVQRQNSQWNRKSFIIQFSHSSQTAKQQNSLPALKMTRQQAHISYTLSILRHNNKYCWLHNRCVCLRTIPSNSIMKILY